MSRHRERIAKLLAIDVELAGDEAQIAFAIEQRLHHAVLTTHRVTTRNLETEHLIANAYRDGRLMYRRDDDGNRLASELEARLRRIAKEDGIEGLRAELAATPVRVPVGQRVLTDDTPQMRRTLIGPDGAKAAPSAEQRASVAEQLGLEAEDLKAPGND